jgi:citrate synthase
MPDLLDSDEAARRLGIKLTTLYAYVSRGVIASHPSPDGRRSLFEVADVERLARRSRGGKNVEARLATVTTGITQLREDGPAYRGRPACAMATQHSIEEVADLLWRSKPAPWVAAELGPPPPGLATRDLLRWSVVMAGATDPIRHDLRPEAVVAAARRLIATMVEVLPGPPLLTGTIAERVGSRLCATQPGPATVRAVNATLVLLADHELATSTLAARLAASTHADLYDIVLAALGTLAGPLHGGASTLVRALLADADQHGPEWAVSESMRWRAHLPGFGHAVYTGRDPRADVLLEQFRRLAGPHQRRTVDRLLEIARGRDLPAPNVDLAVAALGYASGMPPDAGETIFTIARTAGWTAHALEELGERPLRFRARAVYLTGAWGS